MYPIIGVGRKICVHIFAFLSGFAMYYYEKTRVESLSLDIVRGRMDNLTNKQT